MKITRISKFKYAAALQALAIMGAGLAATVIIATPAMAQDYTSGAISGTVTDESGNPVSSATVTLTSKDQGFTRNTTSGSSGAFRFVGLPAGKYDVVVEADGTAGYRAEGVTVLPSESTTLTASLSKSDEIVVTGAAIKQAFGGATTGLAVNVEDLVKTVPISRDLTSVILLSPGTTRGDGAFGNLASIGGSSVAENAYYINGLNITNFDNYLGGAQVPFEFFRSVEVKSGGYQAEFGRATGGIINQVSKSGSNEFKAAVHLNWNPDFLRSNSRDITNIQRVLDGAGNPVLNTDGTFKTTTDNATNRRFDTANSYSAVVEAGGPIFKDRLFVYGLVEFRKSETRTISRTANTAFDSKNDDPFYAIKIDAYPIDNHHLEFTLFDTRNTTRATDIAYSETNGLPVFGNGKSVSDTNGGGVNYVAKYTGQFTDFLSLSAAYGRYRDRFDDIGIAGDANAPYIQNSSGGVVRGIANGGFLTGQTTNSRTSPHNTQREFYRADADLYVNLLGEHHFRMGFDQENNTLNKSSVRVGNNFLASNNYITPAAANANLGGGGFIYILRANNIVELNYFNTGGSFSATNKSFYMQDEWKVTDRLTLNLGLRRDDFSVNRPDGKNIVNLNKNYAPRLSATYDLFENKTGKLYGSYGQYYLPFASNTAFRTTGAEYFFRERFNYNGFDSRGIPILTTQITSRPDYQGACPFGLTPQSSGRNCNVTGDGSVKSAENLISQNLKATKETEFIIGYEHKFGDLKVGLAYTNRRLNNTAEDAAIDAAVNNYCVKNNIAGCGAIWDGFHQYVILNPGKSATVVLDGLDRRTVTFTPEELNYGTAIRKYDAVELTFSKEWDGKWSAGGSYTWSKSRGNSEGFVQSDFGQADAGITQDFDQPGFVDFAYGRLPNDRRHRIKMYGAVALSDQLTLGTNVRIDSERPLSCFGFHPTDVFAQGYGAASHYCGNKPSPRGSAQKSDWISTIDLSARYNIEVSSGQKITFRADVFNLLNSQGVQERNEFGDLDLGDFPAPNYGNATSYQTLRSVRLGVDISF